MLEKRIIWMISSMKPCHFYYLCCYTTVHTTRTWIGRIRSGWKKYDLCARNMMIFALHLAASVTSIPRTCSCDVSGKVRPRMRAAIGWANDLMQWLLKFVEGMGPRKISARLFLPVPTLAEPTCMTRRTRTRMRIEWLPINAVVCGMWYVVLCAMVSGWGWWGWGWGL